MSFPRLHPLRADAVFASVATNASSVLPVLRAAADGEVVAAYFVNSAVSSATSGTTTGSSASFILYKNASSAGSVIATFNGSGTNVAINTAATLLTSGTAGSTNGRFSAGDLLVAEVVGGVANNGSQAGAKIQVDYVYGRNTGSAPSAATGPA